MSTQKECKPCGAPLEIPKSGPVVCSYCKTPTGFILGPRRVFNSGNTRPRLADHNLLGVRV